jgi:CarD family transcriptional regulator
MTPSSSRPASVLDGARRGDPARARPVAPAKLGPGDFVVSPHHGVGRVVERAVRTLFGAEREYLTVEIMRGRIRLMVPADQIGTGATLRPVSSASVLSSALAILATTPVPLAGTWQTRKKALFNTLTTGDVASLAKIVRDYAHEASRKPLAANDRELYGRVRGLVEAELEIGLGLEPGQAATAIDCRLPRGDRPPR